MTSNSLLGHTTTKNILCHTIRKQHDIPLFLCEGPKGVGKKTLCMHVIQTFVSTPVGHPDVHILDGVAASLDDIRALIAFTHKTVHSSSRRFLLLNNIDCLSVQCSNALLKSFEDMSKNTVFLLTATHRMHILPTIASRCIILPCHPLSDTDMKTFLSRHNLTKNTERLLFLAQGIPGQALAFGTSDFCAELFTSLKGTTLQRLQLAQQWSKNMELFKSLLLQWLHFMHKAPHNIKTIDEQKCALPYNLYPRIFSYLTNQKKLQLDPLTTVLCIFNLLQTSLTES